MRSVLVLAALTTLAACASDETSETWSTTTEPTISRSTDDTGSDDTGANDTADTSDTVDTAPTTETACDDGADDDSDGATDCDDTDCAADAACTTPATETVCDDATDDDGDGAIDCDDTDCAEDPACVIVSVACALADGPWRVTATYDADTCGLLASFDVDVTCSGDGVFALDVVAGVFLPTTAVTLECLSSSGTGFSCSAPVVPGLTLSLSGTSDAPTGASATGTIAATVDGCSASGDFAAGLITPS